MPWDGLESYLGKIYSDHILQAVRRCNDPKAVGALARKLVENDVFPDLLVQGIDSVFGKHLEWVSSGDLACVAALSPTFVFKWSQLEEFGGRSEHFGYVENSMTVDRIDIIATAQAELARRGH